MSDLATLTHADFSPHTGTTFDITASDATPVTLELLEVRTRGHARSGSTGPPARQGFSLLFIASPDAPALPQRVYRLEHASLGQLDLFLVPIGPKEVAMQYEAVFN